MGTSEQDKTLEIACTLAQAGVAVHWLYPKTKEPVGKKWSEQPVHTLASLKASYRPGYNLGIRPGEFSKVGDYYLHVIDLDINVDERADEALEALRKLLPEIDAYPFVISGSGGASRHFYVLLDQPFRSKKIARSSDSVVIGGKKKRVWEIELFGAPKQVAAPPSIHPDTGNPYVWGRPLNFSMIEMGFGPIIDSSIVEAWFPDPAGMEAVGHKGELFGDVYERLNTLALANIPAWAPYAYPHGYVSTDGGWRTDSEDLDREYEEALVIHPKGIQDFGPECALTPIWLIRRDFDLVDGDIQPRKVVDWEEESRKPIGMDRDDAAQWLADRLGQDFMAMRFEDQEFEEADPFEEVDEDDAAPAEPSEAKKRAAAHALAEFLGDENDEADDKPKLDEPEYDEEDPQWRSRLDRTEDKGTIKPTLHNLELIVRNDPRTRGLARLNEFTQEIVQLGTPGRLRLRKESPKGTRQLTGNVWNVADTINGDLWVDAKDNFLRSVMEAPGRQGGWGIKVTDRDLNAAVDMAARSNAFHPVREYLKAQKWDGKERVETLFIRHLGAEDNAYSRSIARMFMISAVARVHCPGHKFDFAVILEGLQGKGKSTFIKTLAKHWFAELDGDFHDTKQMIEIMQGAWIMEIPELSGFARADVRAIKAFISRQSDKARLAYARRAGVFHRQCVFMGSTNDQQYLKDDTGGRRFWPMFCTVSEIDIAALRDEVDQLWAEAMQMYRDMRAVQPEGDLPLYLSDKEAAALAVKLQESRRAETAEDALAGKIAAWLDTPVRDVTGFDDEDEDGALVYRNQACLVQIWVEALGRNEATYDSRATTVVGAAMRKIKGWSTAPNPLSFGPKYGKQRAYVRDDSLTRFGGVLD